VVYEAGGREEEPAVCVVIKMGWIADKQWSVVEITAQSHMLL
jgi:hypothetical protein